MQRKLLTLLGATGLALLSLPNSAFAQRASIDDDWWEWALPAIARGEPIHVSRGGRITLPKPVDRGRETRGKKQSGPPFCQNGQGHPVHGWKWCAEKGFGRYSDRGRWERASWGDVVFRGSRGRTESGVLRRGTLIDILGDVVLGRIEDRGRRFGGTAPLSGRWAPTGRRGERVLQIRAGQIPIAELSDLDGDGRIDAILFYQP